MFFFFFIISYCEIFIIIIIFYIFNYFSKLKKQKFFNLMQIISNKKLGHFRAGLKSFCHGRYSKHICQIWHYRKKESRDTHKSLSKNVKFNGKITFHCHIFQQLCPDEILGTEGFRKTSKSSFYNISFDCSRTC